MSTVITACVPENENARYHLKLNGDDLVITFPNTVFLKSYEIRDFENKESGEYERILSKSGIYKDMNQISVDISNLNLESNHSYFFKMAREDSKDDDKKYKTIVFCIKNNAVILKEQNKDDETFKKSCRQPLNQRAE